jgi:hypothetical protein
MFSVKQIRVLPIKANIANDFMRKHHYSGTVVFNSTLHFGCFVENKLGGVMSFGNSLDKKKMAGLVKDTKINNFIELNRMAFIDALPKNSERRCISIALKTIKKQYPHIEWVVSFADATQCGDGTIYRASGFKLVGIKKNKNLCKLPDGRVVHKISLERGALVPRKELGGKTYVQITNGKNSFAKYVDFVGGKILSGFQIKYIYFLHKEREKDLTVPILPFSEIEKAGAKMYKGIRAGLNSENSGVQPESGGANPTPALQPEVQNG